MWWGGYLIDIENRQVVAKRQGAEGMLVKWVKGVKRYKLQVIKSINNGCNVQHGDHQLKNTALHI